ncbi:MAG: hypothetical protein ACK47B_11715 [Armatimonadota bacterium]
MASLLALLTLALSLVACLGYGGACLRLLRLPASPEPRTLLHATALGMGILAYLILAAGLLGALNTVVLGAMVAAGWPAVVLFRPRKGVDGEAAPETVPAPAPGSVERGLALFALVAAGLMALLTLASALKPPDGLDWDSLSYHLAAPKIFLREGRIPFIPYDSHTHFPFTMEMLYTLGLAFGGAAGGKLFHWAAGWLTAAAVGVWTDRLLVNGRRMPQWGGPVAAILFASMPVVLWELGTAYVELGTALFQFLALAALLDAVKWETGGPRLDLRGALLAAVLTGFALGTKMTALLQFGLLGLGLLWLAWRSAGPARVAVLKATLGFGFLALLVGSPWYVKSWLWVGNPVYPFFYSLFPGQYSWTSGMAEGYAGEQTRFGMGRGPLDLLRSFWNLGMHGREFYVNQKALLGDQIGSAGPVWAGLTPLLLFARGLGWRAWACLAYVLGSVLLWFLLTHQVRYLIPVFAPLALVLTAGIAGLPSRWLRGAAGVFVAAAAALSLWVYQPQAQIAIDLLRGEYTEAEYLDQSLPGLYEASAFVNSLPPESKVALIEETRGYYFDRDYFWANPGQHNHFRYAEMRDGHELAQAYRRWGITHVLINFDFAEDKENASYFRLLRDAMAKGRMVPVFASRGAVPGRRGVMVLDIR